MDKIIPALSIPSPLYKEGFVLYIFLPLLAYIKPTIPQANPIMPQPNTTEQIPNANDTAE